MIWASSKSTAVRSSGFTLIELLMVIVILGVAAAILVPQLNVGAEQAKLVTAARSVVQASRYARTMALLHQTETELVCHPSTGTVEVRAKASGSVSGFLASRAASAEPEIKDLTDPAETSAPDEGPSVNTNVAADVATAQSFADEVNAKFESKDIKFVFLGYTDTVENEEVEKAREEGEDASFSVVFRSNGTCRPFKIKVINEEEAFFDVTVDMIGKAKIEGYGDED